ncbi:hypothetical protein B0H16DRAFT_1693430 [Mycena metata]|uniref:Secreted protein n=1 Tax=Mycena metata TaxID=1033252 RepID=A0AAD7IHY7_9AGAR|nr:hypothetical protein B0H16DRAFT_1693430 [Mycena metata]
MVLSCCSNALYLEVIVVLLAGEAACDSEFAGRSENKEGQTEGNNFEGESQSLEGIVGDRGEMTKEATQEDSARRPGHTGQIYAASLKGTEVTLRARCVKLFGRRVSKFGRRVRKRRVLAAVGLWRRGDSETRTGRVSREAGRVQDATRSMKEGNKGDGRLKEDAG